MKAPVRLTRKNLHGYQRGLVKRIKHKKRHAIWAKMGGGKTVSTLTAILDLLYDMKILNAIIFAPLRVANTVWKQEAEKWAHTRSLKVEICTGDELQRREALNRPADIYIINRENTEWLVRYLDEAENSWPYDMTVIDESSSYKNPDSNRFDAIKDVAHRSDRLLELTASPAAQGYLDLWAQIFLIDYGKRLGKRMQAYKRRYFDHNPYSRKYELKDFAKDEIDDKINDVVTVVESYKGMPEVHYVPQYIDFDRKTQKRYRDFEKAMLIEMVNEYGNKKWIEAVNQGVLVNKLLQFCQGYMYDDAREVHKIHRLKEKALKDLREEISGENVIIAYSYQPDIEILRALFPEGRLIDKKGVAIDKWNRGELPELFLHPRSGGHGLNLQDGGHQVIWFGIPWSLEEYEQTNARVARQGQKNTCFIHHLIVRGTMDEVVMAALARKDIQQRSIIQAINDKLLDL